MDWTCLVVDIDETGLADSFGDVTNGRAFALSMQVASAAEAEVLLDTGMVAAMVLFAKDPAKRSTTLALLELFRRKVGPIAQFQAIVYGEPDPQYMNDVFEFGIEQFLTDDKWPEELERLMNRVRAVLDDPEASERRVIELNRSIAKGDKGGMAEAEKSLGQAAQYDYLAAYSQGHALQAIGKFDEAAEAFRASGKMNKYFRPADASLGENLMVMGKVDEAIAIFEKLERTNKNNIDRKATLAVAYLEKGDAAQANKLLQEAAALNPSHPRVTEAKAQMLLISGKVGEAFNLMNDLKDVGPFFAAKLNEMGIKLSQAGKGKSALALYQKAHKIVRKELRYKISLNAALACYRMQDFSMAIKYVARCEQEYGRKLDKTEKIRAACTAALKSKSPATQAG